MRRRRRGGAEDSLDLLLDTICNMFGGIMFIAILIALFTGSKEALEGSTSEQRLSASEALRLEAAVAEMRVRVDALELAADEATLIAALAGSQARDGLSEAIRDKEREIGASLVDARRRRDAAVKERDALRAKAGSLSKDIALFVAESRELMNEEARLRSEIERARKARIVEARLPMRKSTRKIPVHLIVTKGRVFQIYQGYDPATGVSSAPATEDVTLTPLSVDAKEVSLLPTGGFPTVGNLAEHPRWKRLLRQIAPERHFFYVAVFPDSYPEFLRLKEISLEAGFAYDVILMPAGERLVLTPGTSFETQ